MNVIINPGPLAGTVRVPASKSAAHRLLICAALADGPTRIAIRATNRDIEATAACLRALGAGIERQGDYIDVSPIAQIPGQALLDCGESGSTLRFLLPVAAALGTRATFTGKGRLPQRPNAPLVEALRKHGAEIDNDLLPMTVSGPLTDGRWTLPGDVSSQYVTGLLFALPLLDGDSAIALTTPLASAAYVDMTLQALRQFGITVEPTTTGWRIPGHQRCHTPGDVAVEGDWSAAAFWLAANAMGASVDVQGLDPDSVQGDRAVAGLLGREAIDATHVPDLVPALAAVAAQLPQRTVITGAARLRLKESDRLQTVAAMLKALGHGVTVTQDGLIIDGGKPKPCGEPIRTVDGADDHRIVMAAAVAAAHADKPVRILGAQAVEKSYPDFFRDFTALGGNTHVEHAG